MGIALISDRAMRPLNKRFRGLDETTDVLAFPGAFPGARGPSERSPDGYIGEVVISVEEARRQAREDGAPLEAALDRLMIHGILHLKGFDHHGPREAARMRRRERILQRALEELRAAPGGRGRPAGANRRGRS